MTVMTLGEHARSEVHAMLESRGVLRRSYRIRVRLTRFSPDGRIDQTYGAVTAWRLTRRAARAEALRLEVPKALHAALVLKVNRCR